MGPARIRFRIRALRHNLSLRKCLAQEVQEDGVKSLETSAFANRLGGRRFRLIPYTRPRTGSAHDVCLRGAG